MDLRVMVTMTAVNDTQLLHQYAVEGSESAFTELVNRHSSLVFGVAMRSLGQRGAAEEVLQNVFFILSRKAKRLTRHPERLQGWLHRTAVLESRNFTRRERTRTQNMQAYQREHDSRGINAETADGGDLTLTRLDAAIDRLSYTDRRLVLLRFYEGCRYKEIGEHLGKSEDACQKQVTRILAKLGTFLQRRGATVSAAVLTAALTSEFAKAAPPTLGDSLSTQALTGTHTLTQTQLLVHTYPTLLSTKAALSMGVTLVMGASAVWLYTLRAEEDDSKLAANSGIVAEATPLVSVETTTDRGAGESDILLIKTNPDGSEAWSRTFGGTSYERAGAVALAPDGGYIVIGSTSSLGKGNYDIWLIKTDENGQREWSANYGTFYNDYGLDVAIDREGNYLLSGQQQVCEDPNDSNSCEDLPWLAKVDSQGKLLWERAGEAAVEEFEKLREVDAGFDLSD